MKTCSGKDIRLITGILAASMLLGGCNTAGKPEGDRLINDPAAKTGIDLEKIDSAEYDKDEMDALYREYCVKLFSQTIKDNSGDSNIMISPASVMMALDMVAAGAKDESLEQLNDLFAKGQGPLTQQAYAAALMDKINGSKKVKFACANAVWNNKTLLGNKVNMDYVKYIQDTFLAEYTVTEFNSKTPSEINAWVDKNTDHMIREVIDELDPQTVMVLVNAISFDGKWEEQYDEDHVREGDFRAADGSIQNATFLNDVTSAYYETDKAAGFIKSYEGGEYAFLAILPKDDSVSANEFASEFSSEDYEDFINSVSYDYEVYSQMPEFKSDFDCLMNETLRSLGVSDVFVSGKADLSGIGGAPGDIFVSRVIHKTHIEVDSKGTKAAAVTAVTLRNKCEDVSMAESRVVNCDRPFVYAIVDVDTMAPVFIGTVNAV